MRILCVLITLHLATCFAQNPAAVALPNGVHLRFTTDSGNGTPGPLKTEVKPASGDSVYRIFRDETGLAVFAYELRVERTPDGDHFRLIAEPAGAEFAAKVPYADGGKPTPTIPRPIESTVLSPGGRFTIDIPTNPGLWEHRTDSVEIQPSPRADIRAGPLADTRADRTSRSRDKLLFVGLQVFINGKLVSPAGPGTMVSGRYTMFYLPGRGAYFFSTEPDRRLLWLAAAVDGTKLRFTIEGQSFLCNSEAPIVLSERDQVWVYFDRNYQPSAKPRNEFFTAASNSPNWSLP